MPTPPPIPEKSANPIQRAVFTESMKFRVGKVTFDFKLIDESQKKAEAWINANPSNDIVQIQTFNSATSGITVVWYR